MSLEKIDTHFKRETSRVFEHVISEKLFATKFYREKRSRRFVIARSDARFVRITSGTTFVLTVPRESPSLGCLAQRH